MGTSHNFHLNSICKQIWEWCKDRNIWLFPVYINTKENLADRSSRITYIQAEWMLEKRLFYRVLQTLNFSPTIYFFASRLNHRLPTYVSCKPDSYAVDAFSKNLYNSVDPQLKSQIAAKTDLMACIVSGKN